MDAAPLLKRAESLLNAGAVERKVTLARLLYVLHPARETLDLFARLSRPENGAPVGELPARMAVVPNSCTIRAITSPSRLRLITTSVDGPSLRR